MEGRISFEQELRATRLANEQKKGSRSKPAPEPTQPERPWQNDIEQVQQTLREVLRAVASFSGVELPGLPAVAEDDSAPTPRLDIKTLKDRFRNDLEGFSIKTTEELAKKAREQTRAALDAVQSEVGGHIEQSAAELREGLQLTGQVEKLLQPCLEESAARLESSFSQKFENLLAEQQESVQARLQSALSSVQAKMETLEHSVQQARELSPDAAADTSAELNSKVEGLLAEQERLIQERLQGALSSVQAQMSALVAAEFREQLQTPAQIEKLLEPCVGQAAARLETSFVPKIELLINEQEESAQERLQAALSSVQAQMGTLEENLRKIRELKADSTTQTSAELNSKVENLFAEQERSIQENLRSALVSVQTQMSTLEENVRTIRELKADSAAQTSAELNSKVENLLAEQDRLIQGSLQGVLSSVQVQMRAQIAAEFREQLRAPAQIEKLLDPCVVQAAARLETSFVPKIELMINEQEQSAQERLQAALGSVQAQMSTLEQKVQQIRELKADSIVQTSAELRSKLETLLTEQERSIQGSLQGVLSSVQAQMGTLEQKVQQIRELKADSAVQSSAELNSKLEILLTEQERSIQSTLQGVLSSVQAQMGALEQKMQLVHELKADSAAQLSAEQQKAAVDDVMKRYESKLNNELDKVVHLLAEKERLIEARFQNAFVSLQAQMSALDEKMERIREIEADSVARMSIEQSTATADNAVKRAETSLNNGIKDFLDRSFSRIEGSLNSLMETPKFKSVQSTHAKLETLRKSIPNASTEMLIRVQQALDNLDRLGSKNPLPAS